MPVKKIFANGLQYIEIGEKILNCQFFVEKSGRTGRGKRTFP
jgi:hypothetical protein